MFSRRSSITPKEEQIFESFINFLRTELWQIPINEFIEQRSIVFERDDTNFGDVSAGNDAYRTMYTEYRKIVRDLLEAHCADAGTTCDELMKTLKTTEYAKNLSQKEQLLLEPIVAAQDFDVFVPMMMRKNIELQLQALKMIEHLNGLLPSSLKLGQEESEMWNSLGNEDESERFIMISVLKQSREEWERDQRMQKEMLAQMEAAIQESLMDKSALEEMRRREQFLLEQAMNKSALSFGRMNLGMPSTSTKKLEHSEKFVKFDEKSKVIIGQTPMTTTSGTTQKTAPTANLEQMKIMPKSDEKRRKSTADLANNEMKLGESKKETEENPIEKEEKPAKKEQRRISLGQIHLPPQRKEMPKENQKGGDLAYRSLLKKHDGISESQLNDRRQYLREQRDKMLKKKSQEREKQLIEAAKQINELRPQTAKAARELMEQNSEVDEVRRRIAAKLKAEVINGK